MPGAYRRAPKVSSTSLRSELPDTFASALTENTDKKRTSDAAVETRVTASAELRDKFSIITRYQNVKPIHITTILLYLVLH